MIKIKKMKLHFVGIGGIGMSGIAEVFHNQNHIVTGSDVSESATTQRLTKMGIKIAMGHRKENVSGVDVVVISSAVQKDNPEVENARALRIPVIRRAEMLGELMRGKVGISVAGTHGKTTTTSMFSGILIEAGWDPTIVIGGIVNSIGSNAKLGLGQYVIAEADESDGSFLHLPSTYGVITNIDQDHMDHFHSLEALDNAFQEFVAEVPFYGKVAVCAEDPGVLRNLAKFTKPIVTYGLSDRWEYSGSDVQLKALGSSFEVYKKKEKMNDQSVLLGKIELNVPGRHNVLNALGCVALASEMGIDFPSIQAGLKKYSGVERRFQICWQDLKKDMVIVDDYGHHPNEIQATLAAARVYWGEKRIIAVFQPHRYTRTLHCQDGFKTAFRDCDVLYLADIYPAGEQPIEGISSETLANSIEAQKLENQTIHYAGSLDTIKQKILAEFKPGDLLLCMGAGSITKLARELAQIKNA